MYWGKYNHFNSQSVKHSSKVFISEFSDYFYIFAVTQTWNLGQTRPITIPVSWAQSMLMCRRLGGILPPLRHMPQQVHFLRVLFLKCVQPMEALFIGLFLTKEVGKSVSVLANSGINVIGWISFLSTQSFAFEKSRTRWNHQSCIFLAPHNFP